MRKNGPGGRDRADTRTAILDATEKIMREEGYAAVSSRRVAEIAGLKSQLVHYHFGTMDNLFLALFQRTEERYLAGLVRSMTAARPLRSLWDQQLQQTDTRLTIEFIALAVHHKAIREGLVNANERTRKIHTLLIADARRSAAPADTMPPPDVLAFLIAALSRTLLTEETLGTTLTHAAVRDYVDGCLSLLERTLERPA